MSNVISALTNSKLGHAKCMNCGDRWGSHGGIYCRRGEAQDEGKSFQPLGFALSDRCDHCGVTLINHEKRALCDGGETFFEKSIDMFKEEDFIL